MESVSTMPQSNESFNGINVEENVEQQLGE